MLQFSTGYAWSGKNHVHRLYLLALWSFRLFVCRWYNMESFILQISRVSDMNNFHRFFLTSSNTVYGSEGGSFNRVSKDCMPKSNRWSSRSMLSEVHIWPICLFLVFYFSNKPTINFHPLFQTKNHKSFSTRALFF